MCVCLCVRLYIVSIVPKRGESSVPKRGPKPCRGPLSALCVCIRDFLHCRGLKQMSLFDLVKLSVRYSHEVCECVCFRASKEEDMKGECQSLM